jgi:triacylglycerol lipase
VDYPDYWGRIPAALEENGALVYFGNQDGFGSVKNNAGQLRSGILMLCEEFGYEKFNLIAHSKGGIDARYMISQLDMSSYVASLTTVATPHHGIKTIDIYKKDSPSRLNSLFNLFNTMLLIDGGEKPSSNDVYDQLTFDYMQVFNEYVKDSPDVYYQSYACDMKGRYADPALYMFYSRIKEYEGDNDGLVSVDSAKWGHFRGVYSGPEEKGVSHPSACDGRIRLTEKRGLGNICDFYIQMVSELREMGF